VLEMMEEAKKKRRSENLTKLIVEFCSTIETAIEQLKANEL